MEGSWNVAFKAEIMEISDRYFVTNRDWDSCYLRELISEDFYEFKDLWQSNVGDVELVKEVEKVDKYSPVVEDISLDDATLYNAVEEIENE